jgi:uncharacterized protein
MELFKEPFEFEWDAGNRDKNLLKRRVTNAECEEVFYDPHKRVLKEAFRAGEAGREKRCVLIGRTGRERELFVVFTVRQDKVRVISARDLNRRERGLLP